MINLRKKLVQQRVTKSIDDVGSDSRISIRNMLLIKEVQEMEQSIPKNCKVHFEDPNKLHKFNLTITPEEGYWQGGRYKFHIEVPEDYNILPPKVRCSTVIWHPNINEDGEVCLSLLRSTSLDGMGWAPTRKLKDVVWGLSSLFSDLLNFDDPLNVEAAEMYEIDKDSFRAKVKDYVQRHAKR